MNKTPKYIVEGNISIAKFMGWKVDNSFPDKDRVYRLNSMIEVDTTFKYHLSWDHLMKVLTTIEDLGCHVDTKTLAYKNKRYSVHISAFGQKFAQHIIEKGFDKKEVTWKAAVEFTERVAEHGFKRWNSK